MSNRAVIDEFLESAAAWVCDAYSLDIRYLASRDGNGLHLLDALVIATPVKPVKVDQELELDVGSILAGRQVSPCLSKTQLLDVLVAATNGQIVVGDVTIQLDNHRPLDFYSEPHNHETWLANLNLQVIGAPLPVTSQQQSVETSRRLRTAPHPFDGMEDLCSWLGVSDVRPNGRSCAINVRVLPPANLFIEQEHLDSNHFRLRIEAHSKVVTKSIGLALREFPGQGISTRRQVGTLVKWARVKNGSRVGTLNVNLKNADSVLAMLAVNGITVRRHWFVDHGKAINVRYVATQLFDRELKHLRQCVLLDPGDVSKNDSARFEKGISTLFFMLGFAPGNQVETDAPDIIVMSPGGRISIVECTIKTSDSRLKIEKLVARRRELIQKLETSGHNLGVDAFLVCGSPMAQIPIDPKYLAESDVSLLTREDIEYAFYRLRTPVNPDEILLDARKKLANTRNAFH